MEFKLTGGDEALRNLRQIDEAVTDRNLRQDALDAVQPVVEDAKSLAPVDEGDLRDSIESIILDDGSVAVVIGDWKGHFYEFGTVNHRAQPMLIPAWDANADRMEDYFAEAVGARIEGNPSLNRSHVAISFNK